MQEATQQSGADISVSDFGNKIGGLLGADELPDEVTDDGEEVAETTEEVELEENTDDVDDSDDDEAETVDDADIDGAEEAEDDGALPKTISDLAEAIGVDEDYLKGLTLKTKIDGQEGEVTIGQMLKSHQLEGHLTRQSMELAESRKQFESDRQQVNQQLEINHKRSMIMVNSMYNQLQQQKQAIDWAELEMSDPTEAIRLERQFDKQEQWLRSSWEQSNQAIAEFDHVKAQKAQESFHHYISEQEKQLLAKMPEWGDNETRKQGMREVSDVLKEHGFSDKEIWAQYDNGGKLVSPGITDHRILTLARAAIRGKEVNKKTEIAQKKVSKLPKVLKPGSKVSKSEAGKQQYSEKYKKAAKSGSREQLGDIFASKL